MQDGDNVRFFQLFSYLAVFINSVFSQDLRPEVLLNADDA